MRIRRCWPRADSYPLTVLRTRIIPDPPLPSLGLIKMDGYFLSIFTALCVENQWDSGKYGRILGLFSRIWCLTIFPFTLYRDTSITLSSVSFRYMLLHPDLERQLFLIKISLTKKGFTKQKNHLANLGSPGGMSSIISLQEP